MADILQDAVYMSSYKLLIISSKSLNDQFLNGDLIIAI